MASEWVDLDTGASWNGHLVLTFGEHYLIDPSFDQGFSALADRGIAVPDDPVTMVLPLHGRPFTPGVRAHYGMSLPAPATTAFDIWYTATDDESYRDTDAWQDEALPHISRVIGVGMREAMA